jgi:acetyltransferase-like isoleucine patch superfamily enzyme
MSHVPDKFGYISRIVISNPSELFRVILVALNTFKFIYLKRCARKGTVVGLGNQIINSANVQIGKDCLLQDSIYIRAGIDGKVVISDRAAINSFCSFFGHGGIYIGEDTQVGPGTLITTTGHDYGSRNLETHYKPVEIGDRTWIGANVTILQGVKIGNDVVIGAGAVVVKDVPSNSMAAGVPARVMKSIGSSAAETNVNDN